MSNLYENNCVRLIGRLGKDPVVKTEDGKVVITSLATQDKCIDADGDFIKCTNWHNVTFLAEAAPYALEKLKKGHAITVIGMLRTRSWVDKKTNETRYSTAVEVFRETDIDINPTEVTAGSDVDSTAAAK